MPVAAPHDHQPRRRTTSRWASAVVLVAGLAVGGGHAAYAADDPTPSESDVAAPKDRADAKGRDVATVQADLIRANLALETAGDRAAQAAEAWNGARWRAEQARADADEAEDAAEAAREDVESQRELYAATVVQSYEDGTQVQGLSAIVEADEREVTLMHAVATTDDEEGVALEAVVAADCEQGERQDRDRDEASAQHRVSQAVVA